MRQGCGFFVSFRMCMMFVSRFRKLVCTTLLVVMSALPPSIHGRVERWLVATALDHSKSSLWSSGFAAVTHRWAASAINSASRALKHWSSSRYARCTRCTVTVALCSVQLYTPATVVETYSFCCCCSCCSCCRLMLPHYTGRVCRIL